jgi:alkyl hydroperoxide reductase subunit F
MLDPGLREQLSGYLEHIQTPVAIVASLGEDAASRELGELLAELATLHPKLTLRVEPGGSAERTPMCAIGAAGVPPRMRFAGVPLGHELTSLVLALLWAGGHPPRAEPGQLEQIRGLRGELHFETFISLSCQVCPEVVQALHLIAAASPHVRHTMIDGALFPEEVEARQVMAVPSVFLNGAPLAQGGLSLGAILAKLDTAAAARVAESLSQKPTFDVLVVGGGPAGVSAAIYAARKGLRTGLLAERFGGQLKETLGIDNFISVPHTEGPALCGALEQHLRGYEVDVMNEQRAMALRRGDPLAVELASGATLSARAVIAASGARWRELSVPGEREYRGRGVAYCPHCDGPLYRGKRVAVVGGGNSGVEAAIDLSGLATDVTLLEFDPRLRADAILQDRLRGLPNVTTVVGAETTSIEGDGERVTGLVYRERETGAARHVPLDGVFVQIGLTPNTDWLRGVVALTPRGEIEVDARGATDVPGVFAAGDVTTVPFKQIVIASGEGAKAALTAFDYLLRAGARDVAPAAGGAGAAAGAA